MLAQYLSQAMSTHLPYATDWVYRLCREEPSDVGSGMETGDSAPVIHFHSVDII